MQQGKITSLSAVVSPGAADYLPVQLYSLRCRRHGRKTAQCFHPVSSECPNANYERPVLVAKGTVLPQENEKNTAEQHVERIARKGSPDLENPWALLWGQGLGLL